MKNYLLYGIDDYLLLEKKNELTYKGSEIIRMDEDTPIQTLIEEASMYSLFDDKKTIIVEGITLEFFNDNLLKEYFVNPNPNTSLIFIIHTDKLDVKKKIIREALEHLEKLECKKLVGFELVKYITNEFTKEGYTIDKLTVNLFLSLTGENLSHIKNEIEKLKLYKLKDKVILKEDVEKLTSKNLEDNIFELLNKVTSKNKNAVFEVYQDLILTGEEPVKMISSLANQLRIIYQVKYYSQMENKKEDEIAKILAIHPYRVKLAKEKMFDFSFQELLDDILKLANLDIQIKTGKIDKNLGMELLLLSL